MNTKVDSLLRPIELKNNDATHEGFYLDGIPYWQGRAYAEISFARDVSERLDGRFDDIVIKAAELVNACYYDLGYVSKEAVKAAEDVLTPIKPFAKEYTLHLVGHAHMDMNWMWGYDETVNMVLSNISTITALMKEFPFLTFAQSQASVYEIIEKYGDPSLLSNIKKFIKEGRWEVTAVSFVENDKNMPSAESQIRQILYAKNYIKRLLDITDDDLTVAYEPDTFGHNANMPEIYAAAGIKYLYFNRGSRSTPYLSRWVGRNGQKVLCYRDSRWYNARIEPILTDRLLLEADASGQKNLLFIFGTGDHGGGPTKRDINRLKDMQSWPIYPTLVFSTHKKYFEAVEKAETCIKEVSGEKNMIFTGCYSSQSRIKKANRTAERVLGSAEKYCAFDGLLNGTAYPFEKLEKSWRHVLFCQFHDILTGSCTRDSAEYALGGFQKSLALANSQRSYALRRIADRIDTSAFISDEDVSNDTAFGAGGGTVNAMYGNFSASSACGKNRVFTVFNSADFERECVTELTVWDWDEPKTVQFSDLNGEIVSHQVIDCGTNTYWGHSFVRVLVSARVPAFGYTCLFLSENKAAEFRRGELVGDFNRQHFADSFVLENSRIRAEFDAVTTSLISFVDKNTGKQLIKKHPSGAHFRLITEATDRGNTSWRISRYKKVEPLTKNAEMVWLHNGQLQKAILINYTFENSKMAVTVSLDENSDALRFNCKVDWHELGNTEKGVPQLNFTLPLGFDTDRYTYDIPFGVIQREGQNIDCPASSFISAFENSGGVMLLSDCKHGFRGYENSLSVTLVRSSYEPDPTPEQGENEFNLFIVAKGCCDTSDLLRTSFDLQNPFENVCQNASKGDMPLSLSFLNVTKGEVLITAIKAAEDGDGIILRLFNPKSHAQTVTLSLLSEISRAFLCTALEEPQSELDTQKSSLSFDMNKNSFVTLKLILDPTAK